MKFFDFLEISMFSEMSELVSEKILEVSEISGLSQSSQNCWRKITKFSKIYVPFFLAYPYA